MKYKEGFLSAGCVWYCAVVALRGDLLSIILNLQGPKMEGWTLDLYCLYNLVYQRISAAAKMPPPLESLKV